MRETLLLYGVLVEAVPGNTINYHKADRKLENVYPLGDVYVVGSFGYTQNGYGWLRFPLTAIPTMQAYEEEAADGG
jgi:hypothetical protein